MLCYLQRSDPEVADAVLRDLERQRLQLNLIASENYASRAVLEAQGSVLTNKYAEGYPGRRYYGGCVYVDRVERLAQERAKLLFGAEHANVQPHSGSQANFAAYFTVLRPGDRILAMDLAHGGHLTHGSSVNFSGRLFHVIPYGVDPRTERIDYDQIARLAREYRPRLIVAGATAYPRTYDFARLREIADEVGAYLLVDMAHFAGLVAGGVHPNPVPYADLVTSTTHKTLRGPRGGLILCRTELAREVDRAVFPFSQGGPLMHVIAAKAVCFHEAAQPAFRAYAAQVVRNAQTLAEELMRRGYHVTTGGTDNHLILVDLRNRNLTGKMAEASLGEAHIIVNKNMVPFDPQKPTVTSGIRIGTPAVTTRGMKEDEMRRIASWIHAVLSAPGDPEVAGRVRTEVHELCSALPIYPEEVVPEPTEPLVLPGE
ncbi:MAG: serine hydroxymethyltransferase [Armatimonadota bacterium]|nr:serine hydroxymethyltransferase [Armatimonadota bacterium]MDR7440014.1 serine hydroxymethyltransferase [Armatimonadota bacterium]MDR7602238.1 serine hydroxymethyltransferase [Armatimonadota bacterium]